MAPDIDTETPTATYLKIKMVHLVYLIQKEDPLNVCSFGTFIDRVMQEDVTLGAAKRRLQRLHKAGLIDKKPNARGIYTVSEAGIELLKSVGLL